MKISILFLNLFLPLLLFSQSNGFSYSHFDSSYSIVKTAIQTSDNGYTIVVNGYSRIDNISRVTMIRLNKNGQFISSNIIKNDSISSYLLKLLKTEFGFLGVGGAINTVNNKNFLWLIKFDSSFNIIGEQFHETPTNVQTPSIDTDRDSNFIVGSFMFYRGSTPKLFGARINKQGNLTYLTYKYPTDTSAAAINASYPYTGFFDCLQAKKDSARYVLFDGDRVIDVDTNFNIIHTANIRGATGSDLLGLQPTVKRVNDSTYYMGGRYRLNLFFLKTNLKGEHLVFKQLGNSDTLQQQAYYNSIDTTSNGDIYIGGIFNRAFASGYPFIYDTSQFVLYKLNKSYNTIWSRKYGKNNIYDMHGLLATNDGGCLMYGLKYNYNSERTTEAYILKVDADGLITSETSIPFSITTTLLSPNPSYGGLVQTNLNKDVGETDLTFYDLAGRLVKVVHLTVPNQTFDVTDLPIGQYIFHVSDVHKRPLSMGKFVKL